MEMKNLFQRNLRDMEGRYKTDFYVFFSKKEKTMTVDK